MMDIQDFKNRIDEQCGADAVEAVDEKATPKALVLRADQVLPALTLLKHDSSTYFDLLACLTAIDQGLEANQMEVVYNLYSIPLAHALMIKTLLPRDNPQIASVAHLWKTADWHEREAYDLFGIAFVNHPDLRRILMPADWQGHPMRKDYVEPETYRGMKTIRAD